jgi:HAD superfamily hydrolase (TIGR01509 family)
MKPPRFIYFDLGMVLVNFSVEQMLRQVAAVSGIGTETVKDILFNKGLQKDYETGRISSDEFYELFCKHAGTRPDLDSLRRAASEIFWLNTPMLPIAAQLRQAGYKLGILSNTCECHWQYCVDQYRIIKEGFDVYALSYRIGAIKPDAAIFRSAIELAHCWPEEIFFVDDIPGHVDGAQAAGIDAILYKSAPQVAAELRSRGVQFNY